MDKTLLRLKEIRELFKKSKAAFAKMLDIPQPTYLRYETGTQKLSTKLIKSLIFKCNVDIHWFFTGKGEMFIKKYTFKPKKSKNINIYCINEKIKFLIEKNKINKTSFANIVKLKKDRLNAILKNRTIPTIKELYQIGENFDISFDWLVNGDTKI